MKKVLSFLLIIAIIGVGYFCFFDNDNNDSKNENSTLAKIEKNPTLYPLYNRLTEQEKEA